MKIEFAKAKTDACPGEVDGYRPRIESTWLARLIVPRRPASRQKMPGKRFVNRSLTAR
jgi:hypothetical protein